MPIHSSQKAPSAKLGVECLEDRSMPALNLAAGTVLTGVSPAGPNQYITGTGPGVPALVRIFADDGALLQSFKPFGNFTGGVTVGVGDVNADGVQDIIVGTGAGTVGEVKVFSFVSGGLQRLAVFKPFGPNFFGGVNVAAGVLANANPDPTVLNPDQVVCSVASNGPPQVKVFSIDPSFTNGALQIRGFLAYAPTYTGGVSLAVGNIDTAADTLDMNGDLTGHVFSYAEIITGKAQDAPLVRVFDAQDPTVVMDASYMAFDQTSPFNRQGVTLAVGDTIGQRGDQIFVNLKGSVQVRVFNGSNSAILKTFIGLPSSAAIRLSMAVADMTTGDPVDNDFTNTYSVHDLLVVAGDGPFNQVPRIWTGGSSPAGFNGSHPAP